VQGVEQLQPEDHTGYAGKGKEHESGALQMGAVMFSYQIKFILNATKMDFAFSDQMIIAAIIAVVVHSVILYLVINFATKADKRTLYEWAQLELLAKIAKAQGVPEQEIQATFQAMK
jgi:hypothetical protein